MRISIVMAFVFTCAHLWATPTARMTSIVIDKGGHPIEGAHVTMTFDPLQGKAQTKVKGLTNAEGSFSGEGETHPNVTLNVIKEGYYKSYGAHMFTALNKDKTRYEPWGYTNMVVLRKIVDPQTGKKSGYNGPIPELNKALGFDVFVGDWVAPYGKGQSSDFIFTCSNDTTNKVASYILTFPNAGDGIIEYSRNKKEQSIFRWPYQAPDDGYQTLQKLKRTFAGGDSSKLSDYQELPKDSMGSQYIFRVRTQYDASGEISSAYYGKMSGAAKITWQPNLMFGYWLNTDPYSRSLESMDRYSP